ncbi:MAG: helix-turn-helix domain-containing protein [Vicinamibacterales bacterium]|nr:helix-turn-helix domain-containing protein [Vicinamibacterales bacterium]
MSFEAGTTNPFTFSMPRSLSMAQASTLLGISRRTIYYWIKEGRLQTVRTPLGSQRVLTHSMKSIWTARG